MKGFNSLDLYYKSSILEQQANYLVTLNNEHYSVKLYSWDRFFIEEYYNEELQVTKITLAGGLEMAKYLEVISLKDLGYLAVL